MVQNVADAGSFHSRLALQRIFLRFAGPRTTRGGARMSSPSQIDALWFTARRRLARGISYGWLQVLGCE